MAPVRNEAEAASARRQEREAREAREAGTAPPEVDTATGKMINPHNPAFVTQRPWYLGESGPSLKHHAARTDREVTMGEADAAVAAARSEWGRADAAVGVGSWVEALYRGKSPWLPAVIEASRLDGTVELRFESGKKGRVPRSHVRLPRSAGGARLDLERLGKLSWDAKRDQWHGYDATRLAAEAARKFAEIDAERARARHAEEEDEEEEGLKLREDEQQDFQRRIARQGGLGGAQMKTTVRNLRIREDTAKYLRNLDPNSAYYDPKSRAMRENPTPNVDPKDLVYAGDNFARATGDAVELSRTQVFAWDVERKGAPAGGDLVHVQAEPSRTELLKKRFAVDKRDLEGERAAQILDRYGNAAVQDAIPEERALRTFAATTEAYREYQPDGRLAAAAARSAVVASSKYAEDVYVNNHTAVWGSFFCRNTFEWGYADDRSTRRNSYSTGLVGEAAAIADGRLVPRDQEEEHHAGRSAAKRRREDHPDEAELESRSTTRRLADGKPEKKNSQGYNSFASTEVTPEEMEAYRRSKLAAEDPMANFLKASSSDD